MKSVCFVVQMVYDLDVRVRRKAEALAAAGYSVDVMALRAPQGKESYTLEGVNVRTVSLGKKRGSLARYLFEYVAFFLWVFVHAPVQMRRRHYALIDVNTLPDFLIFAPILAKWMGAKLVLDMHEITPEFFISKYGIAENSWIVRLLTYVEKISFRFADHVLTINEPIAELLEQRGLVRSKTTVIMNAADEARFAANRDSSDAKGFPDPDKFVMVYHGTLTRIYGLDIAIEALALCHQEIPGAELWILGSGPEKDKLAELARQRGVASKVKVVGQVPSAEIPGWLNRCDVGILPIRRDVFLDFAFPNKLPEFIISGKTVLVSRLKAIQHYFSEKALEYSEPNDPSDLSRHMVRLHHDRELRDQLRRTATQEYAPIRWDVMKDRYLALVGNLVGVAVQPASSKAEAAGTTLAAK